ncbi:ABC transporter permease [Naasia lichenicola]|uniref:ABC transporter permease n=1 Tax=Naasia lichenicola TaxID=2565933 RepID=A0A4S4FMC9_9MICO|nr:ABC transporter permease [Naasia lichenicola]THG31583.1 ABC transporter permease [Naasia lichenicola]
MLRLIARRVLLSIPLLVAVTAITFFLQSLIPGDPARSLLGGSATQEQLDALRQTLHLDQPVLIQYRDYLAGVLHGDLGRSIFTGEDVGQTLANRLPVSLSLIIGGTVVALLIGILLGVLSATRGRAVARFVDVFSLVGGALPNFWVGLILASFFAVTLLLLPATGYVPFEFSPSLWASSLILPVAALSLSGIATIAKVVRDGISTAMTQDFIRTLRAAGVPRRVLIWRHALRNSAVSLVTVVGVIFVASLSGTILVENVFVLPGLGSLAVTATSRQDIPVIQGVALAFTIVTIVVNLLVDVSYGLLNPKVRTR